MNERADRIEDHNKQLETLRVHISHLIIGF
jgi:hypothetical protein